MKQAYSETATPSPRAARVVFVALRLVMGLVFLYASYDKILHPQDFAGAVYNYQLLPDALVNLSALVLPWVELLIGLCLITGIWLPGATTMGTGLLLIFISALVFNLARGLDIHCGCFSTRTEAGAADIWTVTRDITFLVISVYLSIWIFFFKPAAKPEQPTRS